VNFFVFFEIIQNKGYETKESTKHRKMHSMIGCFLKEELPEKINEQIFFSFSLTFSPTVTKKYFAESREDYDKWINYMKKNIGYSNLLDYYELKVFFLFKYLKKESLGKGKFGTVRAGIHKKTQKRVAIKIMKKAMMSAMDLELVKQEIEILKVCQHPNLIRMLDVFENLTHIYIVMEYLSGGDLFSYLDVRKFRVSEQRAVKIIRELADGLRYLHSYGIVHRDLKPENILMVDKSDNSSVKIVDFGLSKLVGPVQQCKEPFGTLSYVAPEVLLQKPYGKGVDVWSLGTIAYLMLTGELPFDSEDDCEIAKLTIYSEPDYNGIIWNRVSNEGKDFCQSIFQAFI